MTETPIKKNTSVIIVTYLTGAALWVCLYRVLQLKGVHEVIIVNNGNEAEVESHLRKLEQKHAHVKLLSGHGNVGFATGCNLGAQQATGDYVMAINPDAVILEKDALPRLVSVLENSAATPPAGLVGAVLRNEDGTEQQGSRQNILTPQNMLLETLGLYRSSKVTAPRLNLEDEALPDTPMPVPAVSGVCMMMERERYIQMRGFDENYFLQVEDMDLCKRIHDAGGSVWIHPQVNILHFRTPGNVSKLFVERKKAKGYYRYFNLHYHKNPVARGAVHAMVWGRLGMKILASFFESPDARLRLGDTRGLRRVNAIVRGVNAAVESLRQKEPSPLPAGSTVVVLGASSAIGLFAIGRLLAYGCKVIAVKRKTTIGFFHPNLTWVDADVTQPQSLSDALAGKKADYAIHCVPLWESAGVSVVLKAAGVKHVAAFSSSSIQTKGQGIARHEKKTVKKFEEGEALLSSEANACGLAYTLFRPTMIYGAGLDENISRIARVLDHKHAFALPKEAGGKRAPVHADDLALAAIHAVANPQTAGKTYMLQGGETLPYRDMVKRVFDTMGLPPKILPIPKLHKLLGFLHPLMPEKIPHPSIALRMKDDFVFDDNAARADLRIAPRPFLRDGLEDLGQCGEATCRSLLPA